MVPGSKRTGNKRQGMARIMSSPLSLSEDDVYIIALSLRSDPEGTKPAFIMRLWSALSGKTLDLEEGTLWYLYYNVVPSLMVGQTTGIMVIAKIAKALLIFYPEYTKSLDDFPIMPTDLTVRGLEDDNPREDPNEDPNENNATATA